MIDYSLSVRLNEHYVYVTKSSFLALEISGLDASEIVSHDACQITADLLQVWTVPKTTVYAVMLLYAMARWMKVVSSSGLPIDLRQLIGTQVCLLSVSNRQKMFVTPLPKGSILISSNGSMRKSIGAFTDQTYAAYDTCPCTKLTEVSLLEIPCKDREAIVTWCARHLWVREFRSGKLVSVHSVFSYNISS